METPLQYLLEDVKLNCFRVWWMPFGTTAISWIEIENVSGFPAAVFRRDRWAYSTDMLILRGRCVVESRTVGTTRSTIVPREVGAQCNRVWRRRRLGLVPDHVSGEQWLYWQHLPSLSREEWPIEDSCCITNDQSWRRGLFDILCAGCPSICSASQAKFC